MFTLSRYAQPGSFSFRLLVFALFSTAVLHAGCGSSRIAAPSTEARTAVSSSNGINFHLPEGWTDFSHDASKTGIVWLVRNDLKATLAMEEIRGADGTAGEDVDLLSVGKALFALEQAMEGMRVLSAPSQQEASGKPVVAYHVVRPTGEEVQVALVRKQGKVFAVTALQRGEEAPGEFADVAGVQQRFVADILH